MKRAWLLVLALTGCFAKPPYREQKDAAEADADAACAVSTTPGMAISGNRVTWANLPAQPFIEFGEDTAGVPMPTQLSLSGTNILPPRTDDCGIEDRLGIAFYPLFQATGGATDFTDLSLAKYATGPAYTSWTVSWSHDLRCGASSSVAHAESRFSMFADGRISRVDLVTPSQTNDVPIGSCGRCVNSDAIVTTFTAFDRAQVQAIQRVPGPGEVTPPTAFDEDPPGTSEGGCVVDNNNARMTVLWDQRLPSGPDMTRLRVVDLPSMLGSELVFVADLLRSATLPMTHLYSLRTTMVMAAPNVGTCAPLIARARAVQRFPMLAINGEPTAAAPDGLYQLGERDGTVTLRAQSGAIPPGFTVELQMPGTSIETSRDPADVIWHQDPASKRFYVFFKNGLSAGDSITITSSC